MRAAVDRTDVQDVAEAVERQRPRDAQHVTAVHQRPAEAARARQLRVEVHARRILVEARREAVLGLVDGHAGDVIDALADLVAVVAVHRAREHPIEMARPQPRRHGEPVGGDMVRQLGHDRRRRRARRVALGNHDPAHELEDLAAVLFGRARAHVDRAAPAGGVLLEADHLGAGGQGVAGVEQRPEAAIGIAEICDRVQRDVRHAAPERQMEGQEILERRPRQPGHARQRRRAVHGEARAGQRQVQGGVALGHGARRGVEDLLADREVLEEVALGGLAHP